MNEHAFARRLRHGATEAERRLWNVLRGRQRQGFKFRRQVPIEGYVADFASFDAALIVEVDGGQHCEANRDVVRDARLAALGWEVVRYWNPEVFGNLPGVVDDLERRLQGRVRFGSNRGRGRRAFAYLSVAGAAEEGPSGPSGHLPRKRGRS